MTSELLNIKRYDKIHFSVNYKGYTTVVESRNPLFPLIATYQANKLFRKWRKEVEMRIKKHKQPIKRFCLCGHQIKKKKGKHVKCKKCGFRNQEYLTCRNCLSHKVIRKQGMNRCLECGVTWEHKRIRHSKFVHDITLEIRKFLKEHYKHKCQRLHERSDRAMKKFQELRNKIYEFY